MNKWPRIDASSKNRKKDKNTAGFAVQEDDFPWRCSEMKTLHHLKHFFGQALGKIRVFPAIVVIGKGLDRHQAEFLKDFFQARVIPLL